MSSPLVSSYAPLDRASRVAPLGGTDTAGPLVVLVSLGAAAALLTTFVNFKLGIPGHHIVFTMFPLALGFALAPRRGAGTIMSGSALATVAGLGLAGARVPGPGVLTGMLLAGPLLDLALRWGREGSRLYAAFMAVGALANIGAFIVRGLVKYFGPGGLGGTRPFAAWFPVASRTYVIAGLLAGLVSAAAWFHLRARGSGSHKF
jgi:hypothetical protein